MTNEVVQTRIERCYASLPQAVKSTDGAHFRMLLSLLSSNQSFDYQMRGEAASGDFQLSESSTAQIKYPRMEQLYSTEVVGRINRAVNQQQRGELAFTQSWVDTQANTPEGYNALGDSLERLAMQVNGKLMIEQIGTARKSMSLRA